MFKRLLVGLGLLSLGSFASAADITNGLSFVATAPCRIIDTRNGQGFSGQYGPPALVANATRTFPISGTTTGTPVQCGIPVEAEAILANFTVAGFSGAGDIRAFPAGGSIPNASILNYKLENIANMVTVALGAGGAITVQADVSPTQLIVDITGYYLPKHFAAFVNANGTLSRGTHASSAAHLSTGVYQVGFDRIIAGCFWLGTIGVGGFSGAAGSGSMSIAGRAGTNTDLFIQTFDLTGTAADLAFETSVICP